MTLFQRLIQRINYANSIGDATTTWNREDLSPVGSIRYY